MSGACYCEKCRAYIGDAEDCIACLRAERDAAIAERDAERERCAAIAEEMACGPFVEEARVMAGAVAGAIREGGRSGVHLAAIIRKAERVEVLEKALRDAYALVHRSTLGPMVAKLGDGEYACLVCGAMPRGTFTTGSTRPMTHAIDCLALRVLRTALALAPSLDAALNPERSEAPSAPSTEEAKT